VSINYNASPLYRKTSKASLRADKENINCADFKAPTKTPVKLSNHMKNKTMVKPIFQNVVNNNVNNDVMFSFFDEQTNSENPFK